MRQIIPFRLRSASGDVIKEIAQKYENVQKGVGDIMGGALIETEARTILNQGIKQGRTQGISETKKQTALRMLKVRPVLMDNAEQYFFLFPLCPSIYFAQCFKQT